MSNSRTETYGKLGGESSRAGDRGVREDRVRQKMRLHVVVASMCMEAKLPSWPTVSYHHRRELLERGELLPWQQGEFVTVLKKKEGLFSDTEAHLQWWMHKHILSPTNWIFFFSCGKFVQSNDFLDKLFSCGLHWASRQRRRRRGGQPGVGTWSWSPSARRWAPVRDSAAATPPPPSPTSKVHYRLRYEHVNYDRRKEHGVPLCLCSTHWHVLRVDRGSRHARRRPARDGERGDGGGGARPGVRGDGRQHGRREVHLLRPRGEEARGVRGAGAPAGDPAQSGGGGGRAGLRRPAGEVRAVQAEAGEAHVHPKAVHVRRLLLRRIRLDI